MRLISIFKSCSLTQKQNNKNLLCQSLFHQFHQIYDMPSHAFASAAWAWVIYIDAMKDHYSLCFNHSQPTYWPDIYISEGFILHHQIYECRAELGHQYTDWHYSIVLKNATLWGFIIEEEANLASLFVLKRHLNLQVLVSFLVQGKA